MKIVFFGTPEYVIPIFEHLFKNENVICVVTRSDKPVGRHLQFAQSPVKKNASEKNIPVLTPEKLNDKDFISHLSPLNPQLGIVAAYGKLLPKEVLDTFPIGCVNLHFSILPKYRGAAPIQRAIIKGENETGVTGFFMDERMDTGKIIFQKKIIIDKNDDTETLQKKLIPVAVDVLKETIKRVKNGNKGEEQTGAPSYAPPLKKEDGKINWNKSAEEIYNLIRGTKPWPAAFAKIKNQSRQGGTKIKNIVKILESEILFQSSSPLSLSPSLPAGSIAAIEKNTGFVVKCGKNFLLIKSVQPASKNGMSAYAFLLGHNLKIGDKLS